MSFIRTKNIKGQDYAYLVKNAWTAKGPRQESTAYLGKVILGDRKGVKVLAELVGVSDINEYIEKADFKDVITKLVLLELHNHQADNYELDAESLKLLNKKNKKEVVLGINEGFLCSHTIKDILNYDARGDETGLRLASLITAAGIKIEKDAFVSIFGKLRAQAKDVEIEEKKETVTDEFYY